MKIRRFQLVAVSALLFSSCQLASRAPTRAGYDQYGITEVSGSLRLSAEAREEKRTATTGRLDLSELRFREELKLAFAGFYYHPKLLEFELETLTGLEQRDLERTGNLESTRIDGQNFGYNLSMELFKDNPYSAQFYTRRAETLMRQTFFATNETVTVETGLVAIARGWWIPSELKISQYNSVGRGANEFSLGRDSIVASGRRHDDDADYNYQAEVNRVELYGGAASVDEVNLQATTKHQLGVEGQHDWSNSISLRDQSGGLNNSRTILESDYQHSWTENFESDHRISYEMNSREELDTDRLILTSSVVHQLFKSLRSSGGVTWIAERFGEGSIDTLEVFGSFNYTKKIPIGRFGLAQSVNSQSRNRGNLQGVASVIEESFIYQAGVPIYLNSYAVDRYSVVVKDSTGLLVYINNADYFVVQVGSRTRIDIPVTSLISPGDEILVDYDFLPTPQQDLRTTRVTSRMSLTVGDVANFSLGRSSSTQTLTSGFDDGTLDSSVRTSASATYFPWEVTTFMANFEDLESNIIPYRRMSGSVEQRLPIFDGFEWNAAANTYYVTFGDTNGIEKGSSVSSFLNVPLSRTLRGSLRAEYHKAEYLTDSGSGYMAELEVSKVFNATTMALSARLVEEEFLIAEDRSLLFVSFNITRTF